MKIRKNLYLAVIIILLVASNISIELRLAYDNSHGIEFDIITTNFLVRVNK